MNARMVVAALGIAVLFFIQDIHAQDAPPAKESTATLAKTLSWLERHFEANFTYGYSTIETSADTATANHHESVVNRIPVRLDDCNISWRDSDDLVSVSLAALDPLSVMVSSQAQPNTKFDSEVWKVALLTKDRKEAVTVQQISGAIQSRNNVALLYDDKGNADRFARAFQHAIKLCGEQVPSARE